MERIKTYLSNIGLSDDQITDLMNEESESDVSELSNTFLSGHRDMIKTDSDFLKPIQSAAIAKERGSLESKLKRVLKDMGAEKETISSLEGLDSYMDTIRDLNKSASSKKAPELDKLEADVLAANQKLEDYENNIIPTLKSEYESKIENHYISDLFNKANQGYEFITKNPSTATKLGLDYISNNFKLSRSEEGELKVTNKEGGSIFNENSSKTLGVNDLLDKFYSDEGLLKQNTAAGGAAPNPNTPKPNTTVVDKDVPTGFLGVDKAVQRMKDKQGATA